MAEINIFTPSGSNQPEGFFTFVMGSSAGVKWLLALAFVVWAVSYSIWVARQFNQPWRKRK